MHACMCDLDPSLTAEQCNTSSFYGPSGYGSCLQVLSPSVVPGKCAQELQARSEMLDIASLSMNPFAKAVQAALHGENLMPARVALTAAATAFVWSAAGYFMGIAFSITFILLWWFIPIAFCTFFAFSAVRQLKSVFVSVRYFLSFADPFSLRAGPLGNLLLHD
jgi:hypothetical protein